MLATFLSVSFENSVADKRRIIDFSLGYSDIGYTFLFWSLGYDITNVLDNHEQYNLIGIYLIVQSYLSRT